MLQIIKYAKTAPDEKETHILGEQDFSYNLPVAFLSVPPSVWLIMSQNLTVLRFSGSQLVSYCQEFRLNEHKNSFLQACSSLNHVFQQENNVTLILYKRMEKKPNPV